MNWGKKVNVIEGKYNGFQRGLKLILLVAVHLRNQKQKKN